MSREDHGWERKCWGLTRLIFSNAHHSLHELIVVAGYRCSTHRHADRANSFFVDSGRLRVRVFDDMATYDLRPGETVEVPSGAWHRFEVLEGGRVFEAYWPDRGGRVRLDDIERADAGGPLKDDALPPASHLRVWPR